MRIQQIRLAIFATLAAAMAACSTTGDYPNEATDDAERISGGMQRLGASTARSDCFAERIAMSLGDGHLGEAASIVEQSQSKADMRSGVLDASKPVRKAFIGANMRCAFVD